MTDLVIDEEIARRLQEIAEREDRPVNDILRSMVEIYSEKPTAESSAESLLAMDGMFDDDVTDLSNSNREISEGILSE